MNMTLTDRRRLMMIHASKPLSLPSGYEQLEYIKNNSSQLLTLNYLPSNLTDLHLRYKTLRPSNSGCFLFGSQVSGTMARFVFYIAYSSVTAKTGNNTGLGSLTEPSGYVDQVVELHMNNDSLNISDENGNEYSTSWIGTPSWTSTSPLSLYGATNASPLALKGVEIYECIIKENNVKKLHLLPAKRTADSAYGLYDVIENVFYTNSVLIGG